MTAKAATMPAFKPLGELVCNGCGKLALPDSSAGSVAAVFVIDGPWVIAYCSPACARAKRQWPWCEAA